MDAQRQIKEQQEGLQEYLRSLYSWEEEIKKKDAQLLEQAKSGKKSQKDIPPIRGTVPDEPAPTQTQPTQTKNNDKDNITLAAAEKDKGNEFFNKGKYKEAVECYTKSIKLDPTNPIFPANRAMSHLKLQNYEAAESDCTMSITIDPLYVKAYMRRGVARQQTKQYDAAIKDFEHSLKLEPTNKPAAEELAKTKALRSSSSSSSSSSSTSTSTPSSSSSSSSPLSAPSASITKAAPPKAASQSSDSTAKGVKKMTIREVEDEPAAPSISSSPSPSPSSSSSSSSSSSISPSTTSSPAPSVTTPIPAKASAPIGVKVSATTTREALVAMASRVKVTIPSSPPSSSFEFERVWTSISKDNDLIYQYFKIIPPARIAPIFKDSMSSDVFLAYITSITDKFLPNNEHQLGIDILSNLTKIGRFDMLLMFLSSPEKQKIRTLLDNIQSIESVDKAALSVIRKKYSV